MQMHEMQEATEKYANTIQVRFSQRAMGKLQRTLANSQGNNSYGWTVQFALSYDSYYAEASASSHTGYTSLYRPFILLQDIAKAILPHLGLHHDEAP